MHLRDRVPDYRATVRVAVKDAGYDKTTRCRGGSVGISHMPCTGTARGPAGEKRERSRVGQRGGEIIALGLANMEMTWPKLDLVSFEDSKFEWNG